MMLEHRQWKDHPEVPMYVSNDAVIMASVPLLKRNSPTYIFMYYSWLYYSSFKKVYPESVIYNVT